MAIGPANSSGVPLWTGIASARSCMPITESRGSVPRTAELSSFAESRLDALLRIIARAAAPHERATLPCFTRSRGVDMAAVIERRAAEWTRIVTRGDEEAFAALLATRGLSPADARRSIADVEVTHVASLPQWARDVLLLFCDAPPVAPQGSADAALLHTFQLRELSDVAAIEAL